MLALSCCRVDSSGENRKHMTIMHTHMYMYIYTPYRVPPSTAVSRLTLVRGDDVRGDGVRDDGGAQFLPAFSPSPP